MALRARLIKKDNFNKGPRAGILNNFNILVLFVLSAVLVLSGSSSAFAGVSLSTEEIAMMNAAPSTMEAQMSAEDMDIIEKIRAKEQQQKEAEVISNANLFANPELSKTRKGIANNISDAATSETRLKPRVKRPYKPLEITGEKVFILNDVSVKGNFSRYASENFDSYPGFKYSSELRLNLDGNIAENIRVSANLDDTNISQETKKVTLYIDGRIWNFTLGDFTTSYNDTEFTLYNKKLKGIEAVGNLSDGKYQIKAIASRSEGKSKTDVFTGAGMQSEYMLSERPVVQNSEKVKIDARDLKRGTDYTIDYEDGSIILKPNLLPLEPRNRINVEYEYFENGKMFRRTLVGVRGVTEFKDLNKVGFTLLREEDDKGSVTGTGSAEVAVKPTSSTVYGFDYKLNPVKDVKFDGELALSILDPNTLSNTAAEKNVDDFAMYMLTNVNKKKYGLNLRTQRMGRDFMSVGRNRLDIDENKNELSLRLTPAETLNFQFDIENGDRSSLNDPDIPSSSGTRVDMNSRAVRTFSTYKFNKGLALNLNTYERLKRNDSSMFDFHEKTWQGEVSNEYKKFTERARYNLRSLSSKYDLTRKQNEKTYNLGLSSSAWDKLNCAMEYSAIKTDAGQNDDPVSSVNNLSVDLTSNITKKLSFSTVFLTRIEENLQNNRKDNLITTDTKLRYNPSQKVQGQVRYKEMHTKKFLLDKTYNEKILELREGVLNDTNYIKIEEPVTTQTGSFLIDIIPAAKVRSQLQYQFKNLININTRARMSVSDSALAELKLAPNNTISTIYRITNSKNTQSVGEFMECRDLNHNIEFRKSLSSKMAVISNLELDYKTDSYRPLENMDSFVKSMRVEKDLSSALNVSMGLGHSAIKRNQPYNDSVKLSLLSGFRLIPRMFRMTLRGNLDHSVEDDSIIKKSKTVLETLLDYDMGSETEISANYKFTNAGKTDIEEGYNSRAGKVTLTKRF